MFREGKNTKRKGNGQMKWQKIENMDWYIEPMKATSYTTDSWICG